MPRRWPRPCLPARMLPDMKCTSPPLAASAGPAKPPYAFPGLQQLPLSVCQWRQHRSGARVQGHAARAMCPPTNQPTNQLPLGRPTGPLPAPRTACPSLLATHRSSSSSCRQVMGWSPWAGQCGRCGLRRCHCLVSGGRQSVHMPGWWVVQGTSSSSQAPRHTRHTRKGHTLSAACRHEHDGVGCRRLVQKWGYGG